MQKQDTGTWGHFKNRIRELRESRGMEVKELAEKINKSPATLCAYERWHCLPTTKAINIICEVFGVDVSFLMCTENTEGRKDTPSTVPHQLTIDEFRSGSTVKTKEFTSFNNDCLADEMNAFFAAEGITPSNLIDIKYSTAAKDGVIHGALVVYECKTEVNNAKE
jgi:transcriptional regulator with XRE-family HTH domain